MAAVISVRPRRLRKNRLARSTVNSAIRPTELVMVMTITWRMVEPVTKRATGGGLGAASMSKNLHGGEIFLQLPCGREAKGSQPGSFGAGHIVRLVVDEDGIGG